MDGQSTRRSALLALPLTGAALQARAPGQIQLGIATNEFRGFTNAELAKELAGQGIRLVQLFFTQSDSNYWKYGGRSDLPGLTPGRAKEIAAAYRSQGISIHSLAVYTTLVHGDPAERKANLAYFEAMMKMGAHMGVHTFVSEAGHYHPPGEAPSVPYDYQDEVWAMAVATVKELAAIAAANGAMVLLEPIYRSVFASAKRMRVFLEEVGLPHIKALLDPANLLEVNDLDEMFGQLRDWIACVHAKDRKLHVTAGVAAGQGDLDYPKLVRLVAEKSPQAPLIVEYVGAKNYRQALTHLRGIIRQAGLTEV